MHCSAAASSSSSPFSPFSPMPSIPMLPSLALFAFLFQGVIPAIAAAAITERHVHYARANTNDPFYSYTEASLSGKAPGTILKQRSIPFLGLQNANETYQLQYVTTSLDGRKIAEILSIATPKKPLVATGGKQMLLSVQAPEDSAALKCAPSMSLTNKDGNPQGPTQDMDTALGLGMVAISPDYESPASGFSAGKLAGMGVLDGIRAALSFEKVIACRTKTNVGLFGYSGGALASGWAAQLQPSYAPELEIAGASMGGLTVNMKHIFEHLNSGPYSGLGLAGLVGDSNVYPSMGAFIRSHLNRAGKKAFETLSAQCVLQDVAGFSGVDFFSLLDISKEEFHANPLVQHVFNDTTLGAATPKIPLYIFWTSTDDIIVPADLSRYASNQCSKGARIQSKVYHSGDHLATQATGSPDAFQYIRDRLEGTPAPAGCGRA